MAKEHMTMAESISFPSIEMPRRAFLFVGSAALAAGYVILSPTRAYTAPASPAAAVDELPPSRPHSTLLGIL
jgi:hypothetical protein